MKRIIMCFLAVVIVAIAMGKTSSTDINIRVNEHYVYLKAKLTRPLYSTCKYRFDEVTRVGDYDLTSYQRAVYDFVTDANATSVDAVVNEWKRSFMKLVAEDFKEVAEPGESVDFFKWTKTHSSDDNDGIYLYNAPYECTGFIYRNYYAEAGVIEMSLESMADFAQGPNASLMSTRKPFYFSFDKNRELHLFDLFTGNYRTQLLKDVRQWLRDNSDKVHLTEKIDRIPLSDVWAIRDGAIVFIYGKYEIAMGLDGEPEVPVFINTYNYTLTPLGKMLLNCE